MNDITLSIGDRLFSFEDSLEGLDPEKDIQIDFSDINSEFLNQSRLVALYGFLSARCEQVEKQVEFQLDRMYAVLDHQVREEFMGAGVKATEVKIKNTIITNNEYQQLKLELIETTKNKKMFKAVCSALDHKLQALIHAGADHRKHFSDSRLMDSDGFVAKG